MTPEQQRAILSIALLAAFADGSKSDAEREEVRRVADAIGGDVPMASLYSEVVLGRVRIVDAVAPLTTAPLRRLAYELAVGVIDSDRLRTDVETRFLAELGQALQLTQPAMTETAATADALVTMPLGSSAAPSPMPAAVQPAKSQGPVQPQLAEEELDRLILNRSILNGALELLPQSMASLAIIPLQMKLVYRIGRAYGYELDKGHIKELLATLGVGVTGQYLEQIGRKLIGGLFGGAAGAIAGSLARGATGVSFSFAMTYALGQIAKRYYASGRTMQADDLKAAFTGLFEDAKGLQQRVASQIEQRARSVDANQLVQLVRAQ